MSVRCTDYERLVWIDGISCWCATVMASRTQSTVGFPIGGHVNVLSDYKETGPENCFIFYTVTAVIPLIC